MDPVEAGSWLSARPQQLVFVTGLDPVNRPAHANVVSAFSNRTSDRPPLNLKVISGELDLPQKTPKAPSKGIIKRDWPLKYLERVPSLIVLFLDLDWDHASWEEKKTEAKSKVDSIRDTCRQGSRIALVLLQERYTANPNSLATDRAHELSHICQLSSKQLFQIPTAGSDFWAFISKLEVAFHELAQGFYQQKLKAIRARSIPNNAPMLVVRQLFKLAYLSEMRQDTHTALRNYRLAYDQCRDNLEHWDAIDIFEWRSVVGLLNYKMCELCFLHNTAFEAINHMRKHQSAFFRSLPSTVLVYPTHELASIEWLLWKAKECWHFAQLFETAVKGGLTALATLNPGSSLAEAASFYSQANSEVAALKATSQLLTFPYPNPDPLALETIFFGQRPWRVGLDSLAAPHVESAAVTAITHRLVVNHDGVITLLQAAIGQFRKYQCHRMQKKVMSETADAFYAKGDSQKALQYWLLVSKEWLPPVIRQRILQKAAWAAYSSASFKNYIWCLLQLLHPSIHSTLQSTAAESLRQILSGQSPLPPFLNANIESALLNQYSANWVNLLSTKQFFTIDIGNLETFLEIEAAFLHDKPLRPGQRANVCLIVRNLADIEFRISGLLISCDVIGRRRQADEPPPFTLRFGPCHLAPRQKRTLLVVETVPESIEGNSLIVSSVTVELGDRSAPVFGQLEFEAMKALNRNRDKEIVGEEELRVNEAEGSVVVDYSKDQNGKEKGARVECLIGEVAEFDLPLTNASDLELSNVILEFKRSEQQSTEAAAVLFVDDEDNELRSDIKIKVISPIRFVAQLVGSIELILEVSYDLPVGSDQVAKRKSSKIPLSISAEQPFTVSSSVLSICGIPLSSVLNHSEHTLKAVVESHSTIVINSIEWLLADVVTIADSTPALQNLSDELSKDHTISYYLPVRIETREEEVETPLGRIAIVWKRKTNDPDAASLVRSVVPLTRLPVLSCPLSIRAEVIDQHAVVRLPIRINYHLKSYAKECLDMSIVFDSTDSFMFCGLRRASVRMMPGDERSVSVIVMALSAGRLPFPKLTVKSSQLSDAMTLNCLQTLPATLFVLVKTEYSVIDQKTSRMPHQHGAVKLQNEVGLENLRELTEEEKWQIEHAKLHEQHRGHDKMHLEMMLILVVALIVGQIFLVQWKRRHFKSYQFCTLIGMWLIPVYVCFTHQWYRFLFIWTVFTIASTFVWFKASADHISGTTPRMVYKWFLLLHKMSYVLGIAGYFTMMFALMGLNFVFGLKQTTVMDAGILLLFYGLYYGVLGRDFAHICTDRMACKIGYYTPDGLPKKHLDDDVCAVCDNRLRTDQALLQAGEDENQDEKTYRLSCGHTFHEFCIRGWVVVGKLQTCPYCKEKVDLKRMFKNPWEKPHLFYGKLLDWIRYLVCWQPLIVSLVQGLNNYLGLE
ncbi:hypothetical protein WR25_06652 [Diploscapter pachys]|uniref:RING-type domain-containing protein n=1 Tax=Diploscapter pachys TaxID=2018661 RepID=A0A2A2JUA8_9BILA|nr:hypothetical protein WR25_06652 [Diploscapter pachys]